MWLQIATRPDLSFSVNILSRFTHNPGKPHWHALKHVLAYIKGTKQYGITYRGSKKLSPTGFVDSDYAGCKDTRRSMEGNVCYKPSLWLSPFLLFFSLLFYFLFIAWESLSHYVTQGVTMSHQKNGHTSQGHMVVWESSAQTK